MTQPDAHARLVAYGYLRHCGTHPDGSPRYRITWAGRLAVWRSDLDDLHALVIEIMRNPVDAYIATAALTGLAALGIIGIVNAVGRAHGVSL